MDCPIYVVCNTGYEECEFLCAFSEPDEASKYVSRKFGDYDNIVIYKTILGSKQRGEMYYEQRAGTTSNKR